MEKRLCELKQVGNDISNQIGAIHYAKFEIQCMAAFGSSLIEGSLITIVNELNELEENLVSESIKVQKEIKKKMELKEQLAAMRIKVADRRECLDLLGLIPKEDAEYFNYGCYDYQVEAFSKAAQMLEQLIGGYEHMINEMEKELQW